METERQKYKNSLETDRQKDKSSSETERQKYNSSLETERQKDKNVFGDRKTEVQKGYGDRKTKVVQLKKRKTVRTTHSDSYCPREKNERKRIKLENKSRNIFSVGGGIYCTSRKK